MNVYDFDKTIYDGDSSIHFYLYILKKYPRVIRFWPQQIKAAFDYKRGRITKTEMKTIFYRYFTAIDDIHYEVQMFWQKHKKNIKEWYLKQKRSDDLIISASPEFLLQPICDELSVALIASDVDPCTGENLQENCWGPEKVRRMKEKYDVEEMENFYSDSYSDDPLAQYAKKSYLVKGNRLLPW